MLAGVPESVTVTLMGNDPAASGVPEIRPVCDSMLKPFAIVPGPKLQVYGENSPVRIKVRT